MMKMRLYSLILGGGLCLAMMMSTATASCAFCASANVLKDMVQTDFEQRVQLIGKKSFFSVFNKPLSDEQRTALQFLYAYMPLPDLTDYDGDFYLSNVNVSLQARSEMPWGSSVPEREFLHFVLPVRVNNENLDSSRSVFYKELKERVRGLSMYDAVLEVNHWCHEKVTYQPSDSRTSSPLATVRTAYGRCGEESTFTVAALRSIGIPARQVYTPRWAHTDDNHAWVEAWVDGKWYFLGACEPEAVLNLGWFNAPASRGMLMHTKVFGKYDGPEDVVGRNPCYTEINVTENYTSVRPVRVRVMDKNGNPVHNLAVAFKLYNYAEFYTVAERKTDRSGCVSLTAGKGDLLVWASDGENFGFAKCKADESREILLVLNKKTDFCSDTISMDIIPPVERNTVPSLTDKQIAENAHRLAFEDSIRNAYVKTFPTENEISAFARRLGLDVKDVVAVVKASRGNHSTLMDFLEQTEPALRKRALRLLQVISEKDRRDITRDVLADHLATPVIQSLLFDEYVLNPRVDNERLTPYKRFFANAFSEEDARLYRDNPATWVTWCARNIRVEDVWNPQQLCMSPRSVWELRVTDKHSRDIFFVVVARSLGIPARIDGVTGKVQYADRSGQWIDAVFEESHRGEKKKETGLLQVLYTKTGRLDNPKYYSHFTLSKIENGIPRLLSYPEGSTWNDLLKDGIELDAGEYMLVSGQRMADGSVLAHLSLFPVRIGEKTVVPLVMRESRDGVQVIGNFNSENHYFDLTEGKEKSLLSTTGRGYYIIGLISPNQEPTNHALRDIAACRKELEAWGRSIILLFSNRAEATRFRKDDFEGLPSTLSLGTDIDSIISKEIREAMKLNNDNKPIFIIADTFNRVVYLSQGYTIGLGERLVDVIHKLSAR